MRWLGVAAAVAPAAVAHIAPAAQDGAIAGVVEDAPDGGRAVARAWVTLRNGAILRTTLSDDNGRFRFDALPAGRYTLAGAKAAYVTSEYGARVPGRPGTAIAIAAGEAATDVRLVMPRGAVLEGTLRDTAGEPASGLPLALLEWKFENGRRRLVENRDATTTRERAVTDDRGVFRFYGLAPGEYVIAADPPRSSRTTLRTMTDEDIARAERILSARTGENRAGLAAPPSVGARGREQNANVNYARVYYPGTSAPGEATPIPLLVSEERTGLDFALTLVPAVGLSLTVTGLPPDAGEDARVSVTLLDVASGRSSGRGGRSGTYSFPSVAPGRYLVSARYYERTADTGRIDPEGARYWAVVPVVVSETGAPPVTLALEPDIAIAATGTFDGTTSAARPSRAVVVLRPDPDTEDAGARETSATLDSGGRATLHAPPGRYHVALRMFENDDQPALRWVLATLAADDAELTGDTLTIAPGSTPRLTLVVTDRPTELSGLMQSADGRPAPEYFVVAFSPDRTRWTWQSRAVQAVRPDTDGRFVIRGMPPGDYLLAAMTSLDDGEWYDPALLEQLVAAGIPISLAPGSTTTQDIRVR